MHDIVLGFISRKGYTELLQLEYNCTLIVYSSVVGYTVIKKKCNLSDPSVTSFFLFFLIPSKFEVQNTIVFPHHGLSLFLSSAA